MGLVDILRGALASTREMWMAVSHNKHPTPRYGPASHDGGSGQGSGKPKMVSMRCPTWCRRRVESISQINLYLEQIVIETVARVRCQQARQVVGIIWYLSHRMPCLSRPSALAMLRIASPPTIRLPRCMPKRLKNAENRSSNLIVELVVVTHFHQAWPSLRLRQAPVYGSLLAFAFVPVMGAIEFGRQPRCCCMFALF